MENKDWIKETFLKDKPVSFTSHPTYSIKTPKNMKQKRTVLSNPKVSKETARKAKRAVKARVTRKIMESKKEISLRDYFAAKAMGNFADEVNNGRATWEQSYAKIAKHCYKIADAMIAERKKTNENKK